MTAEALAEANIKVVSSIDLPEEGGIGGTSGPASMVFAAKHMCGFVAMHEFGHTAYCPHRGPPGSVDYDLNAIMADGEDTGGTKTGNRVDRIERDAMQQYNPGPIWNN